jgi:hypothetical protein
MVVVDAVSILWLVAAVVWGIALAYGLILLSMKWPSLERSIHEWWNALPPIADLRVRRAREEFNWWWVNATSEQRQWWVESQERTRQMVEAISEVIRATGVTAEEATKAFADFAVIYRRMWEDS